MNEHKQVESSHYGFQRYMTKGRWMSIWHQVDEVITIGPADVLEIGPGPGIFKQVAGMFGVNVETLDLDPELKPDHVGSATALPFPDRTYDLVCAFQVLEHLPYEKALRAFAEMARVARKGVVISLPDASHASRLLLDVPGLGKIDWLVRNPLARARQHAFDGEHYWEINKRGFALSRVLNDLTAVCRLARTYRVHELPYHRFFVFRR